MAIVRIFSETAGAVWKVTVRIGDPVAAGEPVIILESMKMEFPVTCPKDGIVESLAVEEGQMVVEGQLLGTIATL